MSESELQKYVGVYRESENKYRTITRKGAQLYNHMTGFPKNAVYPLTPTEFFCEGPGRLEFVFDCFFPGKPGGCDDQFHQKQKQRDRRVYHASQQSRYHRYKDRVKRMYDSIEEGYFQHLTEGNAFLPLSGKKIQIAANHERSKK